MTDIREKWERRLHEKRLVFELARNAITAMTWIALSAIGSILVVRGYWTLSPALEGMGWVGTAMYVAFAAGFVLIAGITSLVLFAALWGLIIDLRWDLETSESRIDRVFVSLVGYGWYWMFLMFLLIMTALLASNLLKILERPQLPDQPVAQVEKS